MMKGIHGEIINYSFDEYTTSLVQEIKKLYNELDFSKINARDNIILDCYSSVTIEGANTSIDNIKKNKKDKSTLMAINCINATKDVIQNKCNITVEEDLIRLWNTVVNNVCENESVRGSKYRIGMVYVGKHTPASESSIQNHMNTLFDYMKHSKHDTLIKACIAHWYFVYIHPFCDGNGRMARLLLSGLMYEEGYNNIFAVPISNIIMNNINHYYKSIENGENTINNVLDITLHVNYMLSVILKALQFISTNIDSLEVKVFNLINKHAGAEMTVKKCAELLNIDETHARNILNKMVIRGTLIKYKSKNRNYYRKNLL